MVVLVVKMRNLVARKPCTMIIMVVMVMMMMTDLLNRSLYDGGVDDEYDIYLVVRKPCTVMMMRMILTCLLRGSPVL